MSSMVLPRMISPVVRMGGARGDVTNLRLEDLLPNLKLPFQGASLLSRFG